MQLTLYTDYSLRVLLYLAQKEDGPATISEIADFYGISRNHLVKVVHHLGTIGLLHTTRGKGGGVRLAKSPAEIRIGEVVRATEPHFHLVECFDPNAPTCSVLNDCRLKGVLGEATRAFFQVLDGYTLADMLGEAAPAVTVPVSRIQRS